MNTAFEREEDYEFRGAMCQDLDMMKHNFST